MYISEYTFNFFSLQRKRLSGIKRRDEGDDLIPQWSVEHRLAEVKVTTGYSFSINALACIIPP